MTEPHKTIKIGLWGGERTGKTVYLAMLYHELLKETSPWHVYTIGDETERFIKMAREQMIEGRKFPEKTAQHTKYAYEVCDSNNHMRRFVLELMDVPGELADNYYDEGLRDQSPQVRQSDKVSQSEFTPQNLFEHLATCDGILIFLDPERFEENSNETRYSYRQILIQLLEDLRKYRRTNQTHAPYLAFCVTKVDAKHEYWQHHQKHIQSATSANENGNGHHLKTPYEFIAEKLTPTFMERLPRLHDVERIGYFLISSVGRQNNNESNVSDVVVWERAETPRPSFLNGHNGTHTDAESRIKHDFPPKETGYPTSLRNDPQPTNLIQPIAWLMERLWPSSETQLPPTNLSFNEECADNVIFDPPTTPEEEQMG